MYKYLLLVLFLICCTDNPCAYINNKNSNFKININKTTIDNIPVQDPFNLSDDYLSNIIDKQASEVEFCLWERFGKPINIDPKTDFEAWCNSEASVGLFNFRKNIKVKIVEDFSLSQDNTQELLPLEAELSVCKRKRIVSDNCKYRVAVQNCNEIIITPSGYLFKDGLVRVITGCAYPWVTEKLSQCIKPSVPAISGI